MPFDRPVAKTLAASFVLALASLCRRLNMCIELTHTRTKPLGIITGISLLIGIHILVSNTLLGSNIKYFLQKCETQSKFTIRFTFVLNHCYPERYFLTLNNSRG